MKTWTATVHVDLGELSLDEIRKNPDRYKRHFKDVDNPTDAEVRKYFERRQEDYAGSNDGSEAIANADLDIVVYDPLKG